MTQPPDYGRRRIHFAERTALDVEWVMVGVRLPDGQVGLLASTELDEATLARTSSAPIERIWVTGAVQTGHEADLRASLREFRYVAGATFAGAAETLFTAWSPSPDDWPV